MSLGNFPQGVVTLIGPVLTSATAVKMVKTELKEWSSGQGSLDPLGQAVPKLANYQGLTPLVNAVKSGAVNGQDPILAGQNS